MASDLSLVGVGAYVVELGYGGEAVFVEGDAAVGVEEVGLVLVEEVFDAVEVLELPPGGSGAAHWVGEDGVGEVGGHVGVGVVEVGEGGVLAVVGDVGVGALGVGEVRGGEPVEGVGEVLGDAEAEAALAGGGGPEADDIFVRAGGYGVPAGLVFGVPEVVVVVVDAHGEEVFGAGLLVEIR